MPRGVAQGKVLGEHFLELGQEGFAFRCSESALPYKSLQTAFSYTQNLRFYLRNEDESAHGTADLVAEVVSSQTNSLRLNARLLGIS